MSGKDVLKMIKENEVKWVDLRFTDTRGKEQHVSLPTSEITDDFFEEGKMFDGSSIAGWKGINESYMILMPDSGTAVLDVFTDETTLNLHCDVIEPNTMQGYSRDPRSTANRAEAYLKATGIADTAFFGPENEFFVFDDVRFDTLAHKTFYAINSIEGDWASGSEVEDGNPGHRPRIKGGYFPVPPVDSLHDVRSAMCLALDEMGVETEVHHHEVATGGQCEIGAKFFGGIELTTEVVDDTTIDITADPATPILPLLMSTVTAAPSARARALGLNDATNGTAVATAPTAAVTVVAPTRK